MFSIHSTASRTILISATLGLALSSPAFAGTLEDVFAAFNTPVAADGSDPLDFNCDGVIGMPDVGIAARVVAAHSAVGFDPAQATADGFGARYPEDGSDFPFEADHNGDCRVGLPDLTSMDEGGGSGSDTIDLLQTLADDWGTEGESIVDLNCDGIVGLPDFELVQQVVNAQHSMHYDPMSALRQSFGSEAGDDNYHPAADYDGSCVIGMSDFASIFR